MNRKKIIFFIFLFSTLIIVNINLLSKTNYNNSIVNSSFNVESKKYLTSIETSPKITTSNKIIFTYWYR